MAGGDVQRQAPVVLAQGEFDRAFATQPAGRGRQALELAGAGVRALVQARQAGCGQQGIGQDRLPALRAHREELRHQGVAVAVDDEARQAVGFAVHQSHAVTVDGHALSGAHGLAHTLREEGGVDALGFIEAPAAGTDAGGRAEGGPGQEAAVVGLDAHGLAGIATALGDGGVEDPGMTPQQGAFLAFLQPDGFHRPIVAGR